MRKRWRGSGARNHARPHREAAFAAQAIHRGIGDLTLDCIAALAMTAVPIERPML
jgi:hypothetical protein